MTAAVDRRANVLRLAPQGRGVVKAVFSRHTAALESAMGDRFYGLGASPTSRSHARSFSVRSFTRPGSCPARFIASEPSASRLDSQILSRTSSPGKLGGLIISFQSRWRTAL